jgi:LPPG:FO 2-phospho-L-lactate transferase
VTFPADKSIVALSGGVGGAKLVAGLDKVLAPNQLTVVVNTGDDFEHFGLPICPDLDTVLYTLADLNDKDRGWGRRDESWACMETLQALGGEDWFQLGDRDLALHLTRKQWLQQSNSLSQVVDRLCERFGIACSIVPMSDEPVRTYLQTDKGELSFQDYFVRQRCAPKVARFSYRNSENAPPSKGFWRALQDNNLAGVVIGPSNPFVSIDPILSLPGIAETLAGLGVPIVAVSPIVGGKAIKGPAAKMFEELGHVPSALSVARHYGGLLSGFVVDKADREISECLDERLKVVVCDTVMVTQADREALARTTLALLAELGGEGS